MTDYSSTVVKLLDKVSFSAEDGDHLIFTGDLINKGPDSGGVVDLARELSASCVRGNHEDRILLRRREMAVLNEMAVANPLADTEARENELLSTKERSERELARSLSDEQVQWLDQCPVILDVGQISGMGQVVVVHAGLVPGVELEKQDPTGVMTMRTIDRDTHVPSPSSKGTNWATVRGLFFRQFPSFDREYFLASDHRDFEADLRRCLTNINPSSTPASSLHHGTRVLKP